MAAKFLNVDLEIEGPEPLDYLCSEFADLGAYNLHHSKTSGGFLACFECELAGSENCDPNAIISRFCEMIEQFDEEAIRLWKNSFRRTFDLGYEVDTAKDSFQSDLKANTIQRIAKLGASVALTIYPLGLDELNAPKVRKNAS